MITHLPEVTIGCFQLLVIRVLPAYFGHTSYVKHLQKPNKQRLNICLYYTLKVVKIHSQTNLEAQHCHCHTWWKCNCNGYLICTSVLIFSLSHIAVYVMVVTANAFAQNWIPLWRMIILLIITCNKQYELSPKNCPKKKVSHSRISQNIGNSDTICSMC